jgi:ubiquinol-cytochrome c reductase cytochrome b subunit
MGRLRPFFDWLDHRTGYRAGRSHLLDEPLPPGLGWWFITGSILLFLLGVQLLTGLVLTMYYVPSPDNAYDSVRYISERVPFGAIIRGLHFFGASFIVVAAVIHMLRVVLFGSYKSPREVTWMTGIVLLLIILGFALTGYLLPWDQKAYWATTITINIARGAPILGDYAASVMRGGADLGALTLLRWYAAHVIILPAALIGFVLAHLYLMRRHGISGPLRARAGGEKPFYPYQALKDTTAMAVVFALLLTFAILFPVPLDPIADPTDATYIPRPEWYFLSLFELLKYFPGPLEPVATMVIPGLVVAILLLLPFLDRGPDRHPLKRPLVGALFVLLGAAIISLTYLGLRDSPVHADPSQWGPMSLAGREFVEDPACLECHRIGGAASPMASTRLRRDAEWLLAHVADPEIIAPGLRRPPPGGMNESQAHAVLAYMNRIRAGGTPPDVTGETRTAILVYGRHCGNCHRIDGEGVNQAPDLSRIGAEHDADWLREWIYDPEAIDPFTDMPPFYDRLTDGELAAIASYLAARR